MLLQELHLGCIMQRLTVACQATAMQYCSIEGCIKAKQRDKSPKLLERCSSRVITVKPCQSKCSGFFCPMSEEESIGMLVKDVHLVCDEFRIALTDGRRALMHKRCLLCGKTLDQKKTDSPWGAASGTPAAFYEVCCVSEQCNDKTSINMPTKMVRCQAPLLTAPRLAAQQCFIGWMWNAAQARGTTQCMPYLYVYSFCVPQWSRQDPC